MYTTYPIQRRINTSDLNTSYIFSIKLLKEKCWLFFHGFWTIDFKLRCLRSWPKKTWKWFLYKKKTNFVRYTLYVNIVVVTLSGNKNNNNNNLTTLAHIIEAPFTMEKQTQSKVRKTQSSNVWLSLGTNLGSMIEI